MQRIRPAHLPRPVSAALLTLALLLTALHPGTSSAHIRSCRADPIVTLSNGYSFHITASLETDSSDVLSIQYSVHAPQGLSMTSVTYTAGTLANKEQVLFAADQPVGTYVADSVATTGTAGVATIITASVGARTLSASGTSNEHIVLRVTGIPNS